MLKLHVKEFKYTKEIFKETSFIAYPKQLTILTGESGAGKSTLLSILACLHEGNFEGNYSIDEKEMTEINRQEMIFYVTQNPSFIYDLTIYDNFIFFLEAHGRSVDKEEIYDLANKLNMEDKLKLYPKQLSGGEKQKAAIILALCSKMKVILFDEPTASLDSESVVEVLKLIKETDSYLIVSSHSQEVIALADRHYHIKDQKLNLFKKDDSDKDKTVEIDFKQPSLFKLALLLMKQWKYRWGLKLFLLILTVVSILSVTVSFNLGNQWMNESYERLRAMFTSAMLIQKGNNYKSGVYDFSSQNFNEDDFRFISELRDYKYLKVYHRYVNSVMEFLNDGVLTDSMFYHNEEYGYGLLKCFDGQGNQLGETIGIVTNNKGEIITDDYHISTYYEEIDYSFRFKEEYENEGVILHHELARRLGVKEGSVIKISLPVPIYICITKNNIVTNQMGVTRPDYRYVFKFVDVTLPVKGVLDDMYSDIHGGSYVNPVIYLPHTFYENLIQEHRTTEEIEHDFYYILPYSPKTFYLETETFAELEVFKNKVNEESNLDWITGTRTVDELFSSLKMIINQLTMISILIYFGVFLVFFISYYLDRMNQLEKHHVFDLIGLKPSQQLLLLSFEKLPDYIASVVLSLTLLPLVLNYVSAISRNYKTEFTVQMFVTILVLSWIIIHLFSIFTHLLFKHFHRKGRNL